MGKVIRPIADKIVSPAPDRNANRIRIYEKDNGEMVIHFRNFKIMLLTTTEIVEWTEGFRVALEELRKHNYMQNDL